MNNERKIPKLGRMQSQILGGLVRYKGWQIRCGWVHVNASTTKKVLDSLVKKGFVKCEDGFYTPIQDEQGNPIISTVKKDD